MSNWLRLVCKYTGKRFVMYDGKNVDGKVDDDVEDKIT